MSGTSAHQLETLKPAGEDPNGDQGQRNAARRDKIVLVVAGRPFQHGSTHAPSGHGGAKRFRLNARAK